MYKLALALAMPGAIAFGTMTAPAVASVETLDAKMAASDATAIARQDMVEAFGEKELRPGQYLWKNGRSTGPIRVVISLSDQLAYLYRGDELVAVSTISSGNSKKPTPTGIFPILEKKRFYRSIKYENAPMPFMQRIDRYGIALHGGYLPGYPASHGCIRLPAQFAAKLFAITEVGTPVLIGTSEYFAASN